MNETVNQLKKKQDSSIGFGKLFQDLKKHKKLFCKVLAITFVVTSMITLSIPDYYKCTVTLSPEMSGSKNTGGLASLASSFGVNVKGALGNSTEALFPTLYPDLVNSTEFKTSLFTIPVTIEGDKEAGESDRTMTYYEYLTTEQKRTWWSAAISGTKRWVISLFKRPESESDKVDPFRLTKKQASVIEVINKKVVCETDPKTMVISIDVTDQNPLICAMMADSVKMRLQQAITYYRTSKARVDLEYNKKLYVEALARYEKVSKAYVRFADSNKKAFLQSVRQKQSELEDELSLQRSICQQLGNQVLQAEMRVQEDTPAFTTLQNATVPVEKAGPARAKMCIIFLFLAFLATTTYILHKEGDLKPLIGLD
jgi:hypothetical protein